MRRCHYGIGIVSSIGNNVYRLRNPCVKGGPGSFMRRNMKLGFRVRSTAR